MNCPYCGQELQWDEPFGKNLRLDYFGNIRPGFEKVGDIYRCDNKQCEYQGYFHNYYDNNVLREGYPC